MSDAHPEVESLKARVAWRDEWFAVIARDLAVIREIAQARKHAGEELAGAISATINKALGAPTAADAPEPAPAPAPAEAPEVPDDHVPANYAPDVPHDVAPQEEHH